VAQPHPSRLFQPTKRPCWHCGTRHESDTIPALCSDPCREAWQKLYILRYGHEPQAITPPLEEVPKHTNHGCDVEPLLTHKDDGLGRHRAVLQGAPMSDLHDPEWRPADEPQDLELSTCPPRPPESPPARLPLVDPRGMVQAQQPWWKRLLGRSS
jgi:hypothetical protein